MNDTVKIPKGTPIEAIRSEFKNNKTYTYAQIKKVFGKPKDIHSSNGFLRYEFIIGYTLGKYYVSFSTDKMGYEQKLNDKIKFDSIQIN